MPESLLIFVKNPELGKVKTRLAKSIGDEEALQIYKYLLKYTHDVSKSLEVSRTVFYSNFIDENDIWEADQFSKHVQVPGDLGEKMKSAFNVAFENKLSERVVIIGSDCAELTRNDLVSAFEALELHDVVLGPAADGGYYLLGLKSFHPSLFDEINWSTSSVLNSTIEKAQKATLSIHLLRTLNDVDTIEDWMAVKDKIELE